MFDSILESNDSSGNFNDGGSNLFAKAVCEKSPKTQSDAQTIETLATEYFNSLASADHGLSLSITMFIFPIPLLSVRLLTKIVTIEY